MFAAFRASTWAGLLEGRAGLQPPDVPIVVAVTAARRTSPARERERRQSSTRGSGDGRPSGQDAHMRVRAGRRGAGPGRPPPGRRRTGCHSPSLSRTFFSLPISPSCSVKARPSAGTHAASRKNEGVHFNGLNADPGRPSWPMLRLLWLKSACSSEAVCRAGGRSSQGRPSECRPPPPSGYWLAMSRIRSGSGTGRGRSRTWCTTEKRAVLAPMQKARVSHGQAERLVHNSPIFRTHICG